MRDLHGDARQSPDCYIVDPGSGKTYRTIVEIVTMEMIAD